MDVPVNSSVAASVSVEDMVQSSVPIPTNVGIQPASCGTVGSLCLGLVLTSTAVSRKTPAGNLCRAS